MIIAEASLQHGGNVHFAKNCAAAAAIRGADAIKFQMFVRDEPLFCPLEGDDKRWPKWNASIMDPASWLILRTACNEIGIIFMASVFQHGAVDLYKSLNPKWWKVASRAAENFPYEKAGGPFIISLGFGQPFNVNVPYSRSKFLQCRMEYPHSSQQWKNGNGISDHSGSPWPSIDALTRGAEIIEVHVDFGREKKLPEEITLDQLKLICEARDAFAAMREG